MNLIEPKRDGYYVRDTGIYRQNGTRLNGGGLILLGIGTIWMPPAFMAVSALSVALVIFSCIAVLAGAYLSGNTRGALVYRTEKFIGGGLVKTALYDTTDQIIEHPKMQEALGDFEADKYRSWHLESHWTPTFRKLADSIKENIELINEQQREILPGDYHIDVEAHNEMIKPRALEMPIEEEEKPEPKKPVDPKSLGVNFHIRYNELEVIRMALKRDPTFKNPETNSMYKRLLKAKAKLDSGEGFEPVKPERTIETEVVPSNGDCNHGPYEKLTNMAGTWARCKGCGYMEPYKVYLEKSYSNRRVYW